MIECESEGWKICMASMRHKTHHDFLERHLGTRLGFEVTMFFLMCYFSVFFVIEEGGEPGGGLHGDSIPHPSNRVSPFFSF